VKLLVLENGSTENIKLYSVDGILDKIWEAYQTEMTQKQIDTYLEPFVHELVIRGFGEYA